MEYPEDIKQINRKLTEEYGKDIALNLPKFRIAWSEYTEKRYGKFARFTEEGIFLREEEGVYEEPKYLGYCENKWILEELKSTKGNPYLELVVPYSYEPIWTFGAANSNPYPVWRAVQLLLLARLHRDPNKQVKTPSDVIAAEAQRMAREKAVCKDIIKNESPYLAGQLIDGEAVTVPHNYEKRQDNVTENS